MIPIYKNFELGAFLKIFQPDIRCSGGWGATYFGGYCPLMLARPRPWVVRWPLILPIFPHCFTPCSHTPTVTGSFPTQSCTCSWASRLRVAYVLGKPTLCRSVGLGSVKNSEKPMEGKDGRWTRKEGSGGNRSRC